jgi:hypothetical protein
VIASLILIATLAQATVPAGNPEAKAKAKVLLGEGTRLYDRGEFAPALEKFTQAYAEYASPKLLYNIAQTKRALGRLAGAMDAFERFLLETPDNSAEMTADAHAAMVELQGKLGRLHIECSMARAEISVDGKMVGLTPLPDLLWAEPGRHQITARHADAIPFVEDAVVAVGSIRKVAIQLQPFDPSTVVLAPGRQKNKGRAGWNGNGRTSRNGATQFDTSAQSATDGSLDNDSGWWLGRTWTWVAAGSTVALVAASTIASVSMKSKFDSLNQSCGSGSAGYAGCSESDIRGVTDRKNLANALWAISGAAAVTTGILFFVEGRRVDVVPMAGAWPGLTARMSY